MRERCRTDQHLEAALMYGSFVVGDADEYSDIEFWLFFSDEALAAVNHSDWCAGIAPLALMLTDEFGNEVALFENNVRGEFHFVDTSGYDTVRAWPGRSGGLSREVLENMIVLDRRGRLSAALGTLVDRSPVLDAPDQILELCARLVNWLWRADATRRRGEHLRSYAELAAANRYLLWLARLDTKRLQHWPSPAHRAERDLPRRHSYSPQYNDERRRCSRPSRRYRLCLWAGSRTHLQPRVHLRLRRHLPACP